MRSSGKRVLLDLREFLSKLFSHTEAQYGLYAVLTVVLGEMLSTGNLFYALGYTVRRPLNFVAAVAIVYFTYMLTILIPKRIGVFLIVLGTWLGLSIANCVLLSFRVNPLSAVDFSILLSVISIINVYLTPLQIAVICVAIAGAIAFAVFTMIKLPSEKPKYKKALIRVGGTMLFAAVAVFFAVRDSSADMKEMNMPDAYKEYGFVYCFAVSTADRGIDRPEEYSGWGIWEIVAQLESEEEEEEEESSEGPSVIFVQLESFFDPTQILGTDTDADAIPFFRSLKESFPSGYLEVPVSGAGTVNTEFEVLTGIPLSGFGLGEYPYETVLEESYCESIAYYLGSAGYTCHAIHNHTGTFYNRHVVMENLGFDTFTPVEYMNEVKRNSLGWAEDAVLTEELLGVMDSTEGADFVYAISVQPHGKYATEPGYYGEITVTGDGRYDSEHLNAMTYYVNQLSETDATVAQIVSELSRRDEDTVAVFFGDHLPALDLSAEDVESGSLYRTEYVIWSNFDLEVEDCDLESYRLTSHLLDAIGIEGGVISEYHSCFYGEEGYSEGLRELAYDLIFGEKYAYEGAFPYELTNMTFGWRQFALTEISIKYGTLYVMGEGFTECTKVYIDGRKTDTIYINQSLVVCPNVTNAGVVEVAQTAEDGTVLGDSVGLGDSTDY